MTKINEVYILVTHDRQPWFLVEVKSSSKTSHSESLVYFQRQTGAQYAFQIALDSEFVDRDCFEIAEPIIVPAKTFLAHFV